MASIVLEDVTKVYAGDTVGIQEINLNIEDGEFIVMVGPSGCGKSTALRTIAGLEKITSGTIYFDERPVNNLSPGDRDVAMVFQNYALFPHLSVRDNIGFGLKINKRSKDEIDRRVEEVASMLDIKHLLDRRPKTLSGGQRQRAALGRALTREANAFLMDEPLSNLDAKLRVEMRTEISKLHNRIGTTTIYVTHDQTEAMTMADRIVLLKDGVVQQVTSPQEMYDHPANVFVAAFIGSPGMNFVRARLEKKGDEFTVAFGDTRIRIPGKHQEQGKGIQSNANSEVVLGFRPEHLEDVQLAGEMQNFGILDVEAEVIESTGSEKFLYFELPQEVSARTQSLKEIGADVGAEEEPVNEMFVARLPPESTTREGHEVRLVVDAEKVHIFNHQTEEKIF